MLQSNIRSVIARLEEYQAGLPVCVDRALDKAFWLPWLRARAETVLRNQFRLEADAAVRDRYEKMLPGLLERVTALVTPGQAEFILSLPASVFSDVNFGAAAKWSSLSWTPMGRQRKYAMPDAEQETNLAAARQAVLDWVEMEKQRDERDEGLTTDQIAERVQVILGLRSGMVQRTPEMDAAAESLHGAIEAWLTGAENTRPEGTGHAVETPAPDPFRNQPPRADANGVGNALARQWLAAVLETWLVNFRRVFRDRLEAEITKLHKRIKAKQPNLL